MQIDLLYVEDPNLEILLNGFKFSFQAELFGPALATALRVPLAVSKRRNYRFKDRSGSIRRSLHVARRPARYGGKKFKRGRAGLYAGGYLSRGREPRIARHSQLVERGHLGPTPARPKGFVLQAFLSNQEAVAAAFYNSVRNRFPGLAKKYLARLNKKKTLRINYRLANQSKSQSGYANLFAKRGFGARRGFR